MENTFLPLIFRMKHIYRWGLKYNTQQEDLMQHTTECAFLTNYLAIIGNRYFNKKYDVNKITVCALYHDITEVLTGDIPTPIKYYNDDTKAIYKHLENAASEEIKKRLPSDLKQDYAVYLDANNLSDEEKKLIKISDKLCAYIKCIHEMRVGNNEFQTAHMGIEKEIKNIESEELNYFLDHCLASFSLSLDDLKSSL